MQLQGYPKSSSLWIKSYYFTIFKLNKELIAKAFIISDNKNFKCTILIATNIYDMDIDNLDIIFVIQ